MSEIVTDKDPSLQTTRWLAKNVLSRPAAFFLLITFIVWFDFAFGSRMGWRFLAGMGFIYVFVLLSALSLFLNLRSRLRYFDFFLDSNSITVRQAVLWSDTPSASLTYGVLLPHLLRELVELERAKKVVSISEAKISYGDISSVFVSRSFSDSLFGLSKAVIALKSTRAGAKIFSSAAFEFFGIDVLGDNQPEGSFAFRGRGIFQRVVVMPGLTPRDALAFRERIHQLAREVGVLLDHKPLPPAFRMLNVLGALAVIFVIALGAVLILSLF
ncbi:MAG: hypothetical protein Q8R20_03495 [Nanoarchaeota archaeon]|nr:hypothetical protein [Nanoarchaeota archaeon]